MCCFPHPSLSIFLQPLQDGMLFLVQCGIPFKVPAPSFFSVSGLYQHVLICSSHVANAVGPKIMVLEGHVDCTPISGFCMRFDVSPTLMFSSQFSKLIKNLLLICHKSGMFDDGVICLCDSVRGSLYHLFQWVIPVSFFPFLGCVFPDGVGQNRDTGYSITLVEEFINSIKGLWSISLIGEIIQGINALVLHNCLIILVEEFINSIKGLWPISLIGEIIQGIHALVLHHCLGSAHTAPKVLKTAHMLACISSFLSLLVLPMSLCSTLLKTQYMKYCSCLNSS